MNHRHFWRFYREYRSGGNKLSNVARIIILQSGEAVFVYIQDRGFSSFTDNMKILSANLSTLNWFCQIAPGLSRNS